jgi:hypothetical protein
MDGARGGKCRGLRLGIRADRDHQIWLSATLKKRSLVGRTGLRCQKLGDVGSAGGGTTGSATGSPASAMKASKPAGEVICRSSAWSARVAVDPSISRRGATGGVAQHSSTPRACGRLYGHDL